MLETTLWDGVDLSKPIGIARDVVFDGIRLSADIAFEPGELEKLQKACARIVKVGVSKPIPNVKKGEEITIHVTNTFEDSDLTGVLYHVRKPYKDSEKRIYYIREIPSNLR